jgi:hypothetical protein
LVAGAVLATLAGVAASDQAGGASPSRVDFNYQIRPLLSDRCFRCHGPDAAARKAKLRLDRRDDALRLLDEGWAIVKPFDPDRSELVRRITTDDEDDRMPPIDSHLSLSAAERALLTRWVKEGAEYQPHWSFLPVGTPDVPARREATAPANPIDAFVRARLAAEGLRPAPLAAPETLIRRVALNLTGLPPTPAEVDAFLADRSAGAYARMVDRALASPAYGERMAMDWLDLARYADTYGYQADVERDMSPWRDWVIRAFTDNLPYDRFLQEQLAGDLLPNATRAQRIATAFNRLHRQTNEGGSIEEEFRTEYVSDRVNTFGTAMLGLTLECARCHDHKFDAITQRDYYSLSAFFNSIDESGLYSHFTSATPTPALRLWPDDTQAQRHRALTDAIARIERRLEAVARAARPAFTTWRPTARVIRPRPIARLAFDVVSDETTPDAASATLAKLQDGPRPIRDIEASGSGNVGGALRFSGDNAVVHANVASFRRIDELSIALRLAPSEIQDRAVILHQSRAWTDAGSRGFELVLDKGRPFFGLIHFWPGNAIAVRARQPLPIGRWSNLVVTYDGSSRAAGIRLYLDGAPVETEVVRDHLVKDITYDASAGERSSSETPPLTIGARFRDSGFKGGAIDDLQIFDRTLTVGEIGALPVYGARAQVDDAALFSYFLARHHDPYRQLIGDLKAARTREDRLVAPVAEIMVMEETPEPRPTYLLKRGAYDAPGERVTRETPASLPPFPVDQPRNRLGLARWLTDRRHPLTARVVVNRIWRMHFGRGLVASQEDFGSQGRLPTHPELLDWLAARFMDEGWDVKALHRLIVSSETFRQTSSVPIDAIRRDPENRLLARGPRVRLLAEQIRDAALAASGLLARTVGGRSVKPYQPAGLWEQSGTGKTYTPDTGDALYRRSLYTFWRRTSPPPSMLAFDAMSREVCTAKREVTSTPLQALVLLNDPQFVEAARVLAERLLKQFPSDVDARNRAAFRALSGRSPDQAELVVLARLFAEQKGVYGADADAAAKLLGAGAAPWDRTLPGADLAAMTMVASAIMNVDEFITVR